MEGARTFCASEASSSRVRGALPRRCSTWRVTARQTLRQWAFVRFRRELRAMKKAVVASTATVPSSRTKTRLKMAVRRSS